MMLENKFGIMHPEINNTVCQNYEKMCQNNHTLHICHRGAGHRPGLNKIIC
jgi:hypothetical protein